MIGRREPQKGPMTLPIPHIEIAASPPIEAFLFVLWKMRMAQDDNFISLQELPVGKGLESRRRMESLSRVILLITHLTEPPGN